MRGGFCKAGRGELAQRSRPALYETEDGVVRVDHDPRASKTAQASSSRNFAKLGTARQLMCYLVTHSLKLPRRHTTGPHAGTVFWKEADTQMLISLLKNPACAGAFAYGRRRLDPALPDKQTATHRDEFANRARSGCSWSKTSIRLTLPGRSTNRTWPRSRRTYRRWRNDCHESDRFGRERRILTGLVPCGLRGHAMRRDLQKIMGINTSVKPGLQSMPSLTASTLPGNRLTKPWCRSSSACSNSLRLTPSNVLMLDRRNTNANWSNIWSKKSSVWTTLRHAPSRRINVIENRI